MSEDEKKNLISSENYKRSNTLISSKYKSTLFSNRLMAISLSKITNDEAEIDAAGGITLKISGNEIQNLFGSTSHDFFKDLDSTANSMTGRTVGWSNPETKEFEYTSVVTNAKFKDGIFEIEFNKNMNKYLKELDSQYTVLNLPLMLSFKSVYTFRLYEILKSKSYVPKKILSENKKFKIQFDVDELRLILGVVNAELESVQKVLNKTKGKPDYARAVEVSPEKIFVQWYELKRNCIEVAVNEINKNEMSGMYVEYEPLKKGRGGKVYSVVFYIELIDDKSKNNQNDDVEVIDLDEKQIPHIDKIINEEDFLENVMDLIDEKIKIKDARRIAEASNWNIDIIREKYNLTKSQDIENIVGWMISAINNDYSISVSKKKNKFNFEQRKYDFDELERLYTN